MAGPNVVELDDEGVELYLKLVHLTKEHDELAKMLTALKADIKARYAGYDRLCINNEPKLGITRTHPYRFDVKSFQADQPMLYRAYLRPSATEVTTMRFIGTP